MGVHLTRIYTKTGDDGTSSLSDFTRVEKSDPRLIAYADCDEANAALGVAVALGRPEEPPRASRTWWTSAAHHRGLYRQARHVGRRVQ